MLAFDTKNSQEKKPQKKKNKLHCGEEHSGFLIGFHLTTLKSAFSVCRREKIWTGFHYRFTAKLCTFVQVTQIIDGIALVKDPEIQRIQREKYSLDFLCVSLSYLWYIFGLQIILSSKVSHGIHLLRIYKVMPLLSRG